MTQLGLEIGVRRSDCIKSALGVTAARRRRPPILTPPPRRHSSATPVISSLHVDCGAELLPVAVKCASVTGGDAMHGAQQLFRKSCGAGCKIFAELISSLNFLLEDSTKKQAISLKCLWPQIWPTFGRRSLAGATY